MGWGKRNRETKRSCMDVTASYASCVVATEIKKIVFFINRRYSEVHYSLVYDPVKNSPQEIGLRTDANNFLDT